MKVLLCGKGGSGKSTVTALLAKSIADKGYNVLVVASEESNLGLHGQLGLYLPEDFINFLGGKNPLIEETYSIPSMLHFYGPFPGFINTILC